MGVFWESWWLQTRIMDPSLALRPLKRQDWGRREKRSKEIQPEFFSLKLNWQKWSQAERERKLREIEEMRAKQVIFLQFWEHAITFTFFHPLLKLSTSWFLLSTFLKKGYFDWNPLNAVRVCFDWNPIQANGGADDFSLPGCMKIAELVEINSSICL